MPFSIILSGITGGTQITHVELKECTDSGCNSCTSIATHTNVPISNFTTSPYVTVNNINDSSKYIKIVPKGLCSGTTICLPIQNIPSPTPTPTATSTPTPTATGIPPTSTPTPTPTPTSTGIPPTSTPSPTPTPTSTPTPTPTSTESDYVTLYYSINAQAGGRLKVFDNINTQLLDVSVNLSGPAQSGTLYISTSQLPYTIRGQWLTGSGNIVFFRVCDTTISGGELYTSGGIDNMVIYEDYTVNPTPNTVSVNLWKQGQLSISCPV